MEKELNKLTKRITQKIVNNYFHYGNSDHKLTIRVPKKLDKEFEESANRANTTKSDIIKRLMVQFIKDVKRLK